MRILVTGGAGFIGSNLVEHLLQQHDVEIVRVLDNLATGKLNNIEAFQPDKKFEYIQGDIRSYETCLQACEGITHISHQAALGSVPRSINDPLTSNEVNVSGTLNIFTAAKENKVSRVVYAASSSTYGDHPGLPKVEDKIGQPLSPYAVTKYVNELYAKVYGNIYKLPLIGLRYFNVFGPRQDPNGAYAAVIPLFMKAVLNNQPPTINGDGSHSRDFTYVANAVEANVKALRTTNTDAVNQVYNIAYGEQTSLSELFEMIKGVAGSDLAPRYGNERTGDVKHSLADISKARDLLGYDPQFNVRDGIKHAFAWYNKHQGLLLSQR